MRQAQKIETGTEVIAKVTASGFEETALAGYEDVEPFNVGECVMDYVPPSWLIAGKIAKVTETHVLFVDAVYLEQVTEGFSMFDVTQPTMGKPTDIAKGWPVHGKLWIRKDAILMHTESQNVAILGRQREAKAIKGAR